MAGRYGSRKYLKDEDFEEGEVWSVMEEENKPTQKLRKLPFKNSSSSSTTKHFTAVTPRLIPRSSSSAAAAKSYEKQSSAPVAIPDWSKIYGNGHGYRYDVSGCYGDGHDEGDRNGDDDDDDDDEGDDDMVPPHEYLAKKLARSEISSFSVYEGIGRTLKGRDLSKVRNAILTKTGFLE